MIQDSNKLLKEVRQKEGEDDEDLQPDGVINDEIVSMDAYQILKEEFEKLQDQLEEEQNAHAELKKQFTKIDEDIKLSEERMKQATEEREKIDLA